jgi:SAM-dependent MidA family methyltransferase
MPSPLAESLRERIAREGPLGFDAFMEAALYDPLHGYYARGARIGTRGGFTTAPVALPFFGEALAAELRDLYLRLGRPPRFTVAEVGPGSGALARQLVEELSDLPLDLVLCERAEGMLEQSRRAVPTARIATLGTLEPVVGAIVANEVHDACPSLRLRWPHELRVGVGPDRRFRWEEGGEAPDSAAGMLREALGAPGDGVEYDVAPQQVELQSQLAGHLARGALFVFDYGEAGAPRYERPVPRLRTYLAGQPGGDPLASPGTQDITVDVDFGAVRAAGERAGLRTTIDEDQAAWLRRHGALDRARELPAGSQERLWLQALAGEGSSGESFRVLVQERD